MRKEDDDGQKKRIKVLLSAVLRDDGMSNTEREKEIYIQHFDANRLSIQRRDESNPIPRRSSFHSHLFTSS